MRRPAPTPWGRPPPALLASGFAIKTTVTLPLPRSPRRFSDVNAHRNRVPLLCIALLSGAVAACDDAGPGTEASGLDRGFDRGTADMHVIDARVDQHLPDLSPPDFEPDLGPDAHTDAGHDVGTGDAGEPLCGLTDTDGDGVFDGCDVCPRVFDADQSDRDGDRLGDACDPRPDHRDHVLGAGRVVGFGGGAAHTDGRVSPGPNVGPRMRGGSYVMEIIGGWR